MNLKPNSNKFLKLPKIEIRRKSSSRIKITSKNHFSFKCKERSPLYFQGTPSDKRNLSELETIQAQYIQEKDQISLKISTLSKKITAIKELQKKYRIKFTQQEIKKLSEEKLESLAKQKFLFSVKVKAVNTISVWWKRILILSKLKQQDKLIYDSAKRIQNCWKKHLKRKAFKKHLKLYKENYNKIVLKIQSHIRGFLVRQKTRVLIQRKKLEKNFEFFFALKQKSLKYMLSRIISIWNIYKIKQNFIYLYKKTIEKEKRDIMFLLKSSVAPHKKISYQIKFILNKHQNPEESKILSQPASPLTVNTRLRSCTEDFIKSPTLVPNIAY